MRRKRRLSALLLEPVRIRFIGMSVAGLLLIGLTATAERGAAVFGLSYVMRNQVPAAAPLAPSVVVQTAAPTPTASPTPTSVPAPAAGRPPTTAAPTAPPPVRVTLPIRVPLAPPSAAPSPTAATASPVTEKRPVGGGAPPASSTPTPTAAPLSLRIDTGATSYLFQVGAVVPGDTWTRDANVTNTGGVSFRYMIELTQSANTPLWTDPSGLVVRVSSGATILYDGPASAAGVISAPNTVAPGASDALRFVFGLPAGADNSLQGLTQDLQIVVTATQTP